MVMDRNVVVILTSGQRCDATGMSRAWPIATPHLDEMARSGVDLPAVGASPGSGPSIVSLVSGLHVRQHGVVDESAGAVRIGGWARQMAEGGYHVAGVGRVGMMREYLYEACVTGDLGVVGGTPGIRGTSSPGAGGSGASHGVCPYLRYAAERGIGETVAVMREQRMRSGPFELNGAMMNSGSDDIDGYIADQAVNMLGRMPRDRPWVLVVSLTGPGNDLPAPRKYLERLMAGKLGEGFVPADLKRVDRYAQLPHPRLMLQKLTAERVANIRRHYLARVLMVDEMVGRLRQAVEFAGQSDKTWVTLCSDHGMMLGEHGIIGHRAMLGAAMYVPLWVMPPSGLAGIGRDESKAVAGNQLVSTTDFAATVCAIGGVDAPAGGTGRSVLAALQGAEVGRDAVISEYGPRLMLETMRHRVIYDVEADEPIALFDLIADPEERCDLIDTAQAWNVIDVLRLHLAGTLMPLRPVRG